MQWHAVALGEEHDAGAGLGLREVARQPMLLRDACDGVPPLPGAAEQSVERLGVGNVRERDHGRFASSHYSLTVTLTIFTGVRGRSLPSVSVVPILLMTSIPPTILPNTGCLDSPGVKKSKKALWVVLMKN